MKLMHYTWWADNAISTWINKLNNLTIKNNLSNSVFMLLVFALDKQHLAGNRSIQIVTVNIHVEGHLNFKRNRRC